MTPASAIAMLDRFLVKDGEDIVLRRKVGTGAALVNVDVTCRAFVRSPNVQELQSGIAQTDSMVTLSPSEISAAQWPGGELPGPTVVSPSLPRRNDQAIIAGRVRNVETVSPVLIAGTLVRIDLRVLG